MMIDFLYDRGNLKIGIVHIGVGNFHRAHQQYYTNLLLNDTLENTWGISGAMLLPSDEVAYKNLHDQEGIYTLSVFGQSGEELVYRIGSLIELIWAMEKPNDLIERISSENTRIITLTITEGGYNLNKETGEFNLGNKKVVHDILHPQDPQTVFGFVAEGLRKRIVANNVPITILSCDNLLNNGDSAKMAFLSFFKVQDEKLYNWAKDNISFPNSMVDRITPGISASDIEFLNLKNNTNDKAPVYCEDFVQWVIEDNFISGRPNWEKVGVQFTEDVKSYEFLKLSLLNGSHTPMLCYPAFLMGYRRVDEAMQDSRIRKLLKDFMDKDITPNIIPPATINLENYKETLLNRFSNSAVSDQLERLCFDGISKFPVYIMPSLLKLIDRNQDSLRIAMGMAAYRHYLKYKKDDCNVTYEINEPWLSTKDLVYIEDEDPTNFLKLSAFKNKDLFESKRFLTDFLNMVSSIKKNGMAATLEVVIGT
ncbi:mannitol dehydrogenase family protein [Robertkochia solimangrovi]|uniref:mannitol dehydrogenase family protein n=1 Tax=Robertkochia solimangrovi TaxID=2213046 RepID=UPI00117C0F49|nr:mannitol dehydrogenase family protein [Robertkochia solimangrovi]TRZ42475.1 mannitol dehydrogenase family protein [Robertkochia solimangrovi]